MLIFIWRSTQYLKILPLAKKKTGLKYTKFYASN